MTPLRVGSFLAPRMRLLYEEAADAIGGELVEGTRFADLERGLLDAAFLCGLPYVGLHGVEPLVAPALGSDPRPIYYSALVTREDEPGAALEEFAGRRLGVNESDSHSGSNVVLATLAARDVPVGSFTVVETGSHAGSLEAVREGRADVAAIDSHLYAVLGAGEGLRVVERLGPSPSQPLAVGPGVTEDQRDLIRRTLSALPASPEGFRWIEVTDADYAPIREMRAAARARGGF